jgi:dynein heavy chain
MESTSTHEGPDTRLDYMGSFIQKTLKLKPEKWQRLLTFEEHKTVIKDFLDIPTEMVLVIQFTQSAQLLPTTTFPLTQLKAKGNF